METESVRAAARGEKITANNEKKAKSKVWRKIWAYREIYIMLIPAVLTYAVFCYGPMYGVTLAFKEYWSTKGIMASPWVGLEHFHTIFGRDYFWRVFNNTLYLNLLRFVCGFPAPVILALLLNELRSEKYKRCVQTIVYLPHFISWVIIAGIIFALFSNDGMVNSILTDLGMDKVNFLANPKTFRPLVIISDIWKEVGWGTIIYLAAISGISPELYEAAIIDGSNRFQRMLRITLPCLLPTIAILLIMRVGGLVGGGGFDQIFNLYNEAVYDVGDVIDTYTFRTGLGQGQFEIGTAIGLFMNVINIILVFGTNYLSKKLSGTGLY
jgi:putative aldouronate transport system permease protein